MSYLQKGENMTHNQIDFQKHLEDKRHYRAVENETHAYNVAFLAETNRHQLAVEANSAEANRIEALKAEITKAHNVAVEQETNRHNLALESLEKHRNVINETSAQAAMIQASAAQQQARAALANAAANVSNATTNAQNANTNAFNAQTNRLNAVTNSRNATSNAINASANLQNARTNARVGATTAALNQANAAKSRADTEATLTMLPIEENLKKQQAAKERALSRQARSQTTLNYINAVSETVNLIPDSIRAVMGAQQALGY